MAEEDESNYRDSDQSVRGLRTFEQADALRELMQRSLTVAGRDADHCLRVVLREDGLFDLVVLVRVK